MTFENASKRKLQKGKSKVTLVLRSGVSGVFIDIVSSRNLVYLDWSGPIKAE